MNVSDSEIMKACNYIKQGKACTYDGISNELFSLKKLDKHEKQSRLKILRSFLNHSYW